MNAPHRALATFTNAEFERLVRSGGLGDKRVELRRGLMVEMSPQFYQHAAVKAEFAISLAAALKAAGLPWKIFSEVSVAFADGFEPMPDIVVFDGAAVPAGHDGPIPANAVKLIVEVADSSLGDDVGEKLEEYAKGGLAEYWVADVKGRLVLRHTGAQANTYANRDVARFGELIASPTHGFSVDTRALG